MRATSRNRTEEQDPGLGLGEWTTVLLAFAGLLAAALYNPVWVSAVRDAEDFAIALIAFALLVAARWSPLGVVAWCVVASVLRTLWM